MNDLQFSPISEKQEDSIEALSFLKLKSDQYSRHQNPLAEINSNMLASSDDHKQRLHLHPVKGFYIKLGIQKLSEAHRSVSKRRKCYSFQILKQFYLFSSSEESLEPNYKFMRHQLEDVSDKLENIIGIECKIIMGKAFEDIRAFCRKRKTYHDPINISTFVSTFTDVASKIQKQHCISSFRLLKQQELKSQRTICKTKAHQSNKINPNSSLANRSSRFITAEFSDGDGSSFEIEQFNLNEKPSHFKELGESITSEGIYSVASMLFEKNQSKFLKTQASSQKVKQDMNTPSALEKFMQKNSIKQDITNELQQTQKIKSGEFSKMLKNQNTRKAQDIIIVHTSHSKRRKPSREIRVPISGDDVNIIEIQPTQNKQCNKRNKDKGRNRQQMRLNLKEILSQKQKNYFCMTPAYDKFGNQSILDEQPQSSIYSFHECKGRCRYCSVVKEMEAYRLSRLAKFGGAKMESRH